MKLQPQNIQNAIFPIIILNWLTGFSIMEYPLDKPRPILSFIYISFHFGIYIFCCFVNFREQYEDTNEIRKNIFTYLKYSNFIIAICCVVIGWYNYKTWKIIIQRITMMDKDFTQLGIPHKYSKIFINLLWKIVLWIIIICILITMNLIFLLQMLDWAKAAQLIYTLHYPIHVNAVVDFTFTAIISCLGMRFRGINSLLQKTLSNAQIIKYIEKLHSKRNRVNVFFMSTDKKSILKRMEENKITILLIKYLHIELTNISVQVNRIYEIQIAILIGSCCAILTGFYYILFALLFSKDDHVNLIAKISCFLWCITYTYRFFDINATCAKVSSEAQRTKEILCEFKNVIENEELKYEIDQFSLQLTHRPLIFTAYGFFNLDYNFIQKFIERVLMYIVILIQFSPHVLILLQKEGNS